MMRARELAVLGLVLSGALAYAAAQESGLSYANDVEPVFLAECGDCHGAENPKKGLDLSQGRGLANMLDRPSQEIDGTLLLKAGDPAASYLWQKLTHAASEGKGMPRTMFGAKKLPQEQLDLVERWIKEGAKP
jgi:mono/diheme cytochrome c family protein